MDAIYTFNNYSQDSRPRLQFPTRAPAGRPLTPNGSTTSSS